MPHLTTRPSIDEEAKGSLTSLLSRWSLLVALCLPFGACSNDETDKDDEEEKSDKEGSDEQNSDEQESSGEEEKSSDGEENSGDEQDSSGDEEKSSDGKDGSGDEEANNDEDSSTGSSSEDDSETGGNEDEENTNEEKARDCTKIDWGSQLKEGAVVPESTNQGYMDSDGDHTTESEETEVGMCTLHKTRAKCALVVSGFLG